MIVSNISAAMIEQEGDQNGKQIYTKYMNSQFFLKENIY